MQYYDYNLESVRLPHIKIMILNLFVCYNIMINFASVARRRDYSLTLTSTAGFVGIFWFPPVVNVILLECSYYKIAFGAL